MRFSLARCFDLALSSLVATSIALGQHTTQRASVDSSGVQGNQPSEIPSISADGRFVAFESVATNLVVGDTNGARDVFVRDRQNGMTERVSVSTAGTQGNIHSDRVSISADGRFVAFQSLAGNLVVGDTNGTYDIFVRDRQLGTTERASVNSAGLQVNSGSEISAIFSDGRFVAFQSLATNLVAGDFNYKVDVFVRDR
jgi:Tol biopolymer transport system component